MLFFMGALWNSSCNEQKYGLYTKKKDSFKADAYYTWNYEKNAIIFHSYTMQIFSQ